MKKKHGAIGKRLRLSWKSKKRRERNSRDGNGHETIRKSDTVEKSIENTAAA